MKSRYLITASVGLTALALGACGQKPAPAAEMPHETTSAAAKDAKSMRVVRVANRDMQDEIVATGRLVVREEAAVGSELSGFRVAEVYVDEGDWVKKGDRLARLDGTLLQAQIAQAEANLAQQEATVTFKDSQLSRAESLGDAGALSVETIEMRRMETAQSKAALEASRAAVNEMKVRQSRMVLRAPVGGRVLSRSIRPGEIASVASAAPYFSIAREGLVELDAELPDTQLAYLQVGEKAHVTLPTGETYVGTIRFLSPRVDERTGLGRARIELPYEEALRPGSFAEASFDAVATDILTVPASAIRYESGGAAVMVVGSDHRVERVAVKTGEHIGSYVQLLDGPPANTLVLETGAAFTLNGDYVTPVEVEDPAASDSNIVRADNQ